VLLYELLTGSTPLRRETLREAAFNEMLRRIKEEEPPKPSTRLSTTEELPTISANRHTEPARLAKLVRGELDWIVMRCLEKDRTRRYETATALAADLRRHLSHEPVEAGPPPAWYRLRKFGRRNRVALATVAVVATALVAGTAVSTFEAIRAVKAEGLAETRLAEATEARNQADSARQQSDLHASEARAVLDFFINDMIGAASPSRAQGKMPTVDKVLAQADQLIPQRFADQPLIEASIRHALGKAYEELGQYGKAEEHAKRAIELRLARLGPEHIETIAAQNALGWALELHSMAYELPEKVGEELILATRVFPIARKVLGPEHPETLRSVSMLVPPLLLSNRLDEARALAEEYLPICKRVLGPEDPETLKLMSFLGILCKALGSSEKAKQLGEETLAILPRVPADHPDTLLVTRALTDMYLGLGQFDRALELSRRGLDGCVRVLGPAHPFTQGTSACYLSAALGNSVHWEQARHDLEHLVDQLRGEPTPEARLSFCLNATGLALLFRDHDRFAEARPLLEQTVAEANKLRKELPKPDPGIDKVASLAQFLLRRGPGMAPGISPAERPPASFTIDAPFRALSPVADGRIAPGEYGPDIEVRFDDDANPGRLWSWGKSRSKSPDDLSFWVHTAYTERSLFLAFRVRDQYVDDSEMNARMPWLNDSISVFINGDHRTNDFVPGFLFPHPVAGSREGFRLIADAGGHQYRKVVGFTYADWKAGTSRTADGYIIEFEIPLAMIDTKDGPEYVPAQSGSELLVDFAISDSDAPGSTMTDLGIFWAEDPALTPYDGGEELWTVSLRLVPKPAGP